MPLDSETEPQQDHPSSARVGGMEWVAASRHVLPIERCIPEEIAVGIVAGKHPAAVLIASPTDYEDLAWGFALTEGIAIRPSDIVDCRVTHKEFGVRVTLQLKEQSAPRRERTLPSRSSCGLCGLSDLKQAIRPIPHVEDGGTITPDALHAAFLALDAHQSLNAQTHAVHAAAHVTWDGRITQVREDIGRHNALDKLVGALARLGIDAKDGAVLLTSRASYEMVDKAAMAGVRVLAAISAPSALALRKAKAAGMTLIGIARRDSFVAFCCQERLDWRAE